MACRRSPPVPRDENSLYAQAKQAEYSGDHMRALRLYREAVCQGDRVDSAVKDIAGMMHMMGWSQEALEYLIENEGRVRNKIGYNNLLEQLKSFVNSSSQRESITTISEGCNYVMLDLSPDYDGGSTKLSDILNEVRYIFPNYLKVSKIISVVNEEMWPEDFTTVDTPSSWQLQCSRSLLLEFASHSAARKGVNAARRVSHVQKVIHVPRNVDVTDVRPGCLVRVSVGRDVALASHGPPIELFIGKATSKWVSQWQKSMVVKPVASSGREEAKTDGGVGADEVNDIHGSRACLFNHSSDDKGNEVSGEDTGCMTSVYEGHQLSPSSQDAAQSPEPALCTPPQRQSVVGTTAGELAAAGGASWVIEKRRFESRGDGMCRIQPSVRRISSSQCSSHEWKNRYRSSSDDWNVGFGQFSTPSYGVPISTNMSSSSTMPFYAVGCCPASPVYRHEYIGSGVTNVNASFSGIETYVQDTTAPMHGSMDLLMYPPDIPPLPSMRALTPEPAVRSQCVSRHPVVVNLSSMSSSSSSTPVIPQRVFTIPNTPSTLRNVPMH